MDLDVRSPGTWLVFFGLFVCGVLWYLAQGSIREMLNRPGPPPRSLGSVLVFIGWCVLVVLLAVAIFSITDCSLHF
jgi:hypothetical protein